ncbi:MAG: MerR family transcriptional regulator [Planctomycetes bacterium]|nr:MerR family transcriptional regulator [Planctomycetota bacterium]
MAARPLHKMGTLARLTGLSPILLRAWERRYDLLRPERTAGGHRLYTEDDLRLLRRVQELLGQGRSIGEVAALGREALLRDASPPVRTRAPDVAAGAVGWREDLVQAAVEIDARAADRALDEAFAALSPDRALVDVVEPALREVGALWAAGRCSVAGEHLVSSAVTGRLLRLLEAASAQANGGPAAVCACFPDELHALGALNVAYWLARRGHRVTWLGAALPFEDLDRACERVGPEAVFLSVSRAALLEAHTPGLVALVRRRREVRFHVGGAASPEANGALAAVDVSVVPVRSFGELTPQLFASAPKRRGRR